MHLDWFIVIVANLPGLITAVTALVHSLAVRRRVVQLQKRAGALGRPPRDT